MKVLFICGSVQPGKDGVGDYTVRLVQSLLANGIDARIVALNDAFVAGDGFESFTERGQLVKVLRITTKSYIANKLGMVEAFADSYNPDWISLQFVPFAYNPKGLPFNLSRKLKPIIGDRPVHIMFHELWVGMSMESSVKEKGWGWLQKKLITSLVSNLKPVVITTQTQLYRAQLKEMGLQASLLPLFANIPVCAFQHLTQSNSEGCFSMLLFGGIHPDTPIEQFAKNLEKYAKENELQVMLKLLGRSGGGQSDFIACCNKAGIKVEVLGEQPVERISFEMHHADAGLTTTPLALIEKSGSVASMLAHGLPVICLAKKWSAKVPVNYQIPLGVIRYEEGAVDDCFEQLYQLKSTGVVSHNVADIAAQLADAFNKNMVEHNMAG